MAISPAELIPSGLQLGAGLMQGLINLIKPKPQRPVYQVPESQRLATEAAERGASGEMPGFATAKGTLAETSGSAMENIKESLGSSPSVSGSVADILAKTNQANEELATKSAQYKATQNQQLQNALTRQAAYEDKGFDYNQAQKYSEEAGARSALTQASMENIFSGASNIAGTFAYEDLKNRLFPNNQRTNQTAANTAQNAQNTAQNTNGSQEAPFSLGGSNEGISNVFNLLQGTPYTNLLNFLPR